MIRYFLFLLLLSGLAAANAALLPIAEARARAERGETVEAEGVITCQADDKFVLEDDSGGMTVNYGALSWRVGDRVRLTGRLHVENKDANFNLLATSIKTLEHLDAPPAPIKVTPLDLRHAPHLDYRRVQIRGVVTDVFRDEIDPEWTFAFLEVEGERTVFASWEQQRPSGITRALIEAEVSVCGLYQPRGGGGGRRHIGAYISCFADPQLRLIRPAPTDAFCDTPTVTLDRVGVERAVRSGHRHHLSGKVVASWNGQLLLQTEDDQRLRVLLAPGQTIPPPGDSIVVSGFVRRSLFFTHLTNALWKPTTPTALPPDTVTDITAKAILTDNNNVPRIQAFFHGRLVRLEGAVQNLYHPTTGTTTLVLRDDDRTVDVQADFTTDLPVGTRLRATGACLLNEQLTADGSPFTRLTGFSVILRSPDDLVIVAKPPWWTPARLVLVIGLLTLVVVAILIWNVILQKIVNRRSRQLLRETLAREEADLRTSERMRLAVELHDSIAQNLTGVSLQLDAISQAYETASPMTGRIIAATKRMLDACCNELRDCLWDLRSSSLDRRDTSAALRQAIAPHLGEAEATIDVRIPRGKLSDTLFHTLLNIVRELTVNALRHGKAHHIHIAGGLCGEAIDLSVSDDGTGFDPAKTPGVNEGHFGLQGIRERLDALGGTLTIDSSIGRGTRVSLTIET